MAQGSSFDMSKMSTASKILLGGGVLFLIDTFLPWQRVCVDLGALGGNVCGSASGASGIGIINLLLALALVVWEGLAIAGVNLPGVPKTRISVALAGGIVVFTLLKILVDSEALFLFAFVGIVLALVIGYGGWMRWQEGDVASPPAPHSPGGTGFTS